MSKEPIQGASKRQKRLNLLPKILGIEGHKALEPLLKNNCLASFILPKAVVSYLDIAQDGQIDLEGLSVSKSQNLYSGSININKTEYEFSDASGTEVAALICLAQNKRPESDLKGLDLAKLSKTITALVKAQATSKEPLASMAKPREPEEPEPQIPPDNSNGIKRGPAVAKTMMVPDKHTSKACKACGKDLWKNKEFVGCTCVKSMSKSVTTKTIPGYSVLTFGSGLDVDSIVLMKGIILDAS
jgi:hypothetical protein